MSSSLWNHKKRIPNWGPHLQCECCTQYGREAGSECGSVSMSSVPAQLLAEKPALEHLSLDHLGPRCFHHPLSLLASYDDIHHPLLRRDQRFNSPLLPPQLFRRNPPGFLYIPPCVDSLYFQLPRSTVSGHSTDSLHMYIQPNILERLTSCSLKSNWGVREGSDTLAILAHSTSLKKLALDLEPER